MNMSRTLKNIVETFSIEKEPVGIKHTDEDPGVEGEEGSYTNFPLRCTGPICKLF